MKKLLTLTVIVAAVAVLASAPMVSAADMQGKVKTVDPSGRWLTLETGMQFMIPTNVQVDRQALQPGTDVKVSYETQGSQKIITAIDVRPASK
jgi:Protein of unknown function (DUF1344)